MEYMNLKMPYGISNYEELVTENYYYVDKTEYIEKLEELPEKSLTKNFIFSTLINYNIIILNIIIIKILHLRDLLSQKNN